MAQPVDIASIFAVGALLGIASTMTVSVAVAAPPLPSVMVYVNLS